MNFFCYDDDPRLESEGLEAYRKNSGSFAVITNNLNDELIKRKRFASKDEADAVGFASGLKWDFGFSSKNRFLINVWESNILPNSLIDNRQRLESKKYKVFGLSDQISQVWMNYGFQTNTVNIGCDTEFWCPQQIEKFDKFTILSTTSLNFRSGIQHTIRAFKKLWDADKNVRLIIKNTDERATFIPSIIEQLKKQGMDIIYICQRNDIYSIRNLMAQCHVLAYNVIHTSAGLPILESAAMGLPCITGDFCPTNLYPSCEKIKVSEIPLLSLKEFLIDKWGLPYTFNGVSMNENNAIVFWMDDDDFAQKLLNIKNNYDIYLNKALHCRKEVMENWTWKNSCDQLLKNYD